MRKSFVCTFITIIIFCGTIVGQQSYTRVEAAEDLKFVYRHLDSLHPGLYNHQTEAEFRKLYQAIINDLEEEVTSYDLYRKVALMVASTGERHTWLRWYDPESRFPLVRELLGDSISRFPFALKYIGDDLVIWDNYSKASLIPRGSKIISFHGYSVQGLLDEMAPYVTSDGCIVRSKYVDIAAGFPVLLPLIMGPIDPTRFQMEIRLPDGRMRNHMRVAGLSRLEQRAILEKRNAAKQPEESVDAVYDLRFIDSPHTAYLALKTFEIPAYDKTGYNYKKLYRSIFKQIKQADSETLILDLRDNAGGDTQFLYHFMSFLFPKKPQKYLLESYNVDTDKTFRRKFPRLRRARGFDGELYLLINSRTFSNASALASYLREWRDDLTIVGTETAGRYDGLTASWARSVVLPHSGLEIMVPTQNKKYYVSKQEERCRGVLPDHEVFQEVDDLLEGRDTQLEYVIKLIGDMRNEK